MYCKLENMNLPRWVKAFAVAGLVLAVLVVVVLLTGHGPGRHGGG